MPRPRGTRSHEPRPLGPGLTSRDRPTVSIDFSRLTDSVGQPLEVDRQCRSDRHRSDRQCRSDRHRSDRQIGIVLTDSVGQIGIVLMTPSSSVEQQRSTKRLVEDATKEHLSVSEGINTLRATILAADPTRPCIARVGLESGPPPCCRNFV